MDTPFCHLNDIWSRRTVLAYLLFLNPLINSMDPVSTVSGLDLDCWPMLILVNQLTEKIILNWNAIVKMIYTLSWDQRLKKYIDLK